MKTPKTAKVYEWDWTGVVPEAFLQDEKTFSVGVFQWIPKESGHGLRRGVSTLIKGSTKNPEAVYDRARAECARRNQAQKL